MYNEDSYPMHNQKYIQSDAALFPMFAGLVD